MLKNFKKKNRNFQLFKNMKEIINNNINILKDLNVIKNENDKIKFLSYAFKIYEQMNNKNINSSNSIQKENINFNRFGSQDEKKLINKSELIKNNESNNNSENIEEKNNILIYEKTSKNIFAKEKMLESNNVTNKIIQENKFKSKLEILIDKINKNDKIYFL